MEAVAEKRVRFLLSLIPRQDDEQAAEVLSPSIIPISTGPLFLPRFL